MSKRQHSLAQPEGQARRRPGTGGREKYFRIEVHPKARYVTYRLQDVGRSGHTKRLACRTRKGRWTTKSWLIYKTDAVVKNVKLLIKRGKAAPVLKNIRGTIRHLKGDIFFAKPRRTFPSQRNPRRGKVGPFVKISKKRNVLAGADMQSNSRHLYSGRLR
jgi:hypothetical protein